MSTHETDQIFKDYNEGNKSMDETNESLKNSEAGFHLEPLSDEERAEKNRRENIEGTVENPNPDPVLPKTVDMGRRTDLIGAPACERKIIQKTAHGRFLVEYDEQGYAVSSTKIPVES